MTAEGDDPSNQQGLPAKVGTEPAPEAPIHHGFRIHPGRIKKISVQDKATPYLIGPTRLWRSHQVSSPLGASIRQKTVRYGPCRRVGARLSPPDQGRHMATRGRWQKRGEEGGMPSSAAGA